MAIRITAALLGLGLVAGLFSSSQAAFAGPTTMPAGHCDQCKMVQQTVLTGVGANSHIFTYATQQHMECPGCRDALSNLFTKGQLAHSCSICGEDKSGCEGH